MPMGPELGGFAYFAGTKFLGYSAFAHVLRKKFSDSGEGPKRTFQIGGLRTLIGVGAGISYGALMGLAWEKVSATHEALGWILFFGGMLPLRFGEWYWLLRLAFKDKIRGHPQTMPSLALGTLVSYGLDAIGVAAAFVLPGGMWVC